MHIALFINSLGGGGAERAFVNLARGLVQAGTRVDLVLSAKEGPYLAELPPEVRVIDLADPSYGWPSIIRFRRYLKSEHPNVVISALKQSSRAALLGKFLSGGKVRVIPTLHGMLWEPDKRMRHRIGRAIIYRWAHAIAAVSAGVAEDFARFSFLPRDRITVIYNPIITPELPAKAAERPGHPWFEVGSDPVVLAVGRLIPEKDHTTLVRAFAALRKHVRARLVILGEGEQRPALEELVRDLGLADVVSLPGFATNPYAYMSRAAALVLSSTTEGLPTVLIEALALGVPIVSTDCPSGPREILAGGKYGTLVPMGDAEAMANAIASQLRNPPPKEPLVEHGRNFSLEKITAKFMHLLG